MVSPRLLPLLLLLLGQAAAQYNVYYGYTPQELDNFIADTVRLLVISSY